MITLTGWTDEDGAFWVDESGATWVIDITELLSLTSTITMTLSLESTI